MKMFQKTFLYLLLSFFYFAPCNAADDPKEHLGKRSVSFGSSEQATALLSLMGQQPNKNEYQISYETEADTVIFGCSLVNDTIARIHQRRDGTGTAEKWTGSVKFRLQTAAKGGSLNDTDKGKIPGSFSSF